MGFTRVHAGHRPPCFHILPDPSAPFHRCGRTPTSCIVERESPKKLQRGLASRACTKKKNLSLTAITLEVFSCLGRTGGKWGGEGRWMEGRRSGGREGTASRHVTSRHVTSRPRWCHCNGPSPHASDMVHQGPIAGKRQAQTHNSKNSLPEKQSQRGLKTHRQCGPRSKSSVWPETQPPMLKTVGKASWQANLVRTSGACTATPIRATHRAVYTREMTWGQRRGNCCLLSVRVPTTESEQCRWRCSLEQASGDTHVTNEKC